MPQVQLSKIGVEENNSKSKQSSGNVEEESQERMELVRPRETFVFEELATASMAVPFIDPVPVLKNDGPSPFLTLIDVQVEGKNILLKWLPVPESSSYKVYWGTQKDPISTGSVIENISETFVRIPDLRMGQTYYIVVASVNNNGSFSRVSNILPVVIPLAPPVQITTQVKVLKISQELIYEERGPSISMTGTQFAGSSLHIDDYLGEVTISWPMEPGIVYNLYWGTRLPLSKVNAIKIPNVTSPYIHRFAVKGKEKIYYFLTILDNNFGESLESKIFSVNMNGE